MFRLISDCCFIRYALLRRCFGLLFMVLVAASHTAHCEEISFASDLDIYTIQPVRSSADQRSPYRISLNLAFTRAEDTAPLGAGFGNAPRLEYVAGSTHETIGSIDNHWKIAPDNALNAALNSLSALLRYESKNDRFVIKPRRNSLLVEWRKAF